MGNVIGYLTYDGKDSRDFGVVVSSIGTHKTPVREVEDVVVAGRNGTLTIDKGRFENIELSYIAMILDDFNANFDAFKAFLMSRRGYKRLEDSFDPAYYRLAKIHNDIDPDVITLDAAGKFEIPFNCDPRRFLKEGEDEINIISGTNVIYNPTYYDAKPLLKVNSTDAGTITINSKVITVSESVTNLMIDLETYNAYIGSTNMNDKVSIADGIVLTSGRNTIIRGTHINSLKVMPRWWTI